MRTEDFSNSENRDAVYSELFRISERYQYTFGVKSTV